MASIERRGKTWRARWRAPDGGSRSKTFRRKLDAERYLIEVEHSKPRGGYVDPARTRTLFADYARSWFATKADVSPRTRVNIDGRLRNYVIPTFGDRQLGAIEPPMVRAWVASMADAGLSPATVRATYNVLAAVLRQAEADRLIARTPCLEIRLPSIGTPDEMRFLTPAQIGDVAEAIAPRFRVAILTAAYTGMRAGELWALRVDRLDLLRGEVEVAESAYEVGGRWETKAPKSGRRRTIALPGFLAAELGAQIGEHSAGGYVFTSAEGEPVRHRNFMRRHFDPATGAAGVDPLRFHDLRHTCAALLIDRGHSLHEIKDQLGHSSIRVTSDRYGHLYPEARRRVASSLDDAYLSAPRVQSVSSALLELPRNDVRRPRKGA